MVALASVKTEKETTAVSFVGMYASTDVKFNSEVSPGLLAKLFDAANKIDDAGKNRYFNGKEKTSFFTAGGANVTIKSRSEHSEGLLDAFGKAVHDIGEAVEAEKKGADQAKVAPKLVTLVPSSAL